MCGIVACLCLPEAAPNPESSSLSSSSSSSSLPPACTEPADQVRAALTLLAHRGPDGTGALDLVAGQDVGDDNDAGGAHAHAALGVTRLAVSDVRPAVADLLSTPFYGEYPTRGKGTCNLAMVYNGEIYNRESLRHQHSTHVSRCDTETLFRRLLALAAATADDDNDNSNWNDGFSSLLCRLQGMFAFVLVFLDARNNAVRVVAARDAMGVKPLFVGTGTHSHRGAPARVLTFASEMKALPSSASTVREVDPGSWMEARWGGGARAKLRVRTRRWYRCDWDAPPQRGPALADADRGAVQARLRQLLDAAVGTRLMMADVDVGVLLSGGLDSSLVAALAARCLRGVGRRLKTFTIGFAARWKDDDDALGDLEAARLVAAHIGSDHTEWVFDEAEGIKVLPEVVKCLETDNVPTVRAAVLLYLLSRRIKTTTSVKVLLCGEGADELFAGYSLFAKYDRDHVLEFTEELHRRVRYVYTCELLRVDRCTSAFGLEGRVPFLDTAVVEWAMCGVLPEWKMHAAVAFDADAAGAAAPEKAFLRETFSGSGLLPDAVLYRPKAQFATGVGGGWTAALTGHAAAEAASTDEAGLYRALLDAAFDNPPRAHAIRGALAARSALRKTVCGAALSRADARAYLSDTLRLCPAMVAAALGDGGGGDGNTGAAAGTATTTRSTRAVLDAVAAATLARVPFHNLTLLARTPRAPPSFRDIRDDTLAATGGPCAVLNTFTAWLLARFAAAGGLAGLRAVRLVAATVAAAAASSPRVGAHVAVVVVVGDAGDDDDDDGEVYGDGGVLEDRLCFVDVGNGKPYAAAAPVPLASCASSSSSSPPPRSDCGLVWRLHRVDAAVVAVQHRHNGEWRTALTFAPSAAVPYSAFLPSIRRSRTEPGYNPFLLGLRVVRFPALAATATAGAAAAGEYAPPLRCVVRDRRMTVAVAGAARRKGRREDGDSVEEEVEDEVVEEVVVEEAQEPAAVEAFVRRWFADCPGVVEAVGPAVGCVEEYLFPAALPWESCARGGGEKEGGC
ncbi:asparagine synthase-domain-containing protein [Zopfochytrium polystomum]|nr:asparagine synthase-domain-containing protein [Zopfochytrium polystomum]